MTSTRGTFYVVATPIGNLDDISLRAINTLKQVNWIAAEDTRHSTHLLRYHGIHTPLRAVHDHNEKQVITMIENALQQGESIALISDAGTPLISDPGYALIHQLRQKNFSVVPIPGACAAIAALSAAGLPSDRFCFEGFLPAKQIARLKHLQALAHECRTMIFYEAPHRILDCVQDCLTVFGSERKAVLARELTKTFESFYYLSLSEMAQQIEQQQIPIKGEMVLLIAGHHQNNQQISTEAQQILMLLLTKLSLKDACQLTAQITGISKNALYDYAIHQEKL